jgi:hypothetical protein
LPAGRCAPQPPECRIPPYSGLFIRPNDVGFRRPARSCPGMHRGTGVYLAFQGIVPAGTRWNGMEPYHILRRVSKNTEMC